MSGPAPKNWFRRQAAAEQPPPSTRDREGDDVATKRIAAYAPAASASSDTSSIPQGVPEHSVAPGSEAAGHRSAGEEVDAILQTARDSAAKVLEAATKEAERTRAEANVLAARELEQARDQAQTEREQVAKVRADAEAHAARVRNEAEAAAEKVRKESEALATSLIEEARTKLAAADAVVTQKQQAAEESSRARMGALQVEARRHEDRLQQLLAVLQGMISQAEAVLEESHDVDPADQDPAVESAHDDLGRALREEVRSERVG
jgi:hypothetical protein